jgi:hypothetical protein
MTHHAEALRGQVIAYDFSSWQGYLLPLIAPATERIRAVPDETVAQIVHRLPENFKGTLVFHIDLTSCQSVPRNRSALVRELQGRNIVIV